MRITKKFIVAGAGVLALVAGGGTALAAAGVPVVSGAAALVTTTVAPKITAERAMQIAHQAVPGAWISEVEHDTRGTSPDVWEVKLVKGTQRYEVYVDAATGRVTKQELRRADGDDDSRHGGGDDDNGGDRHGGRSGDDD
ncbi:PepSY domain-containing protein [Nonomuraea jiangxiensis]|uniref:Peptidase propeptide and YPEB domain-containing protein n=1 Tax=Nonomuraea jiangxiensis TaxID=633440 RepID=A0A1G7YCR9_9ACTN|nr:PepSY domain-containing protein [Nonomuraea jiangxiensis]SDG94184.1 Peptidase propeptide and YPEB domain-containing protein [Nonomuraea jiangxiensis]